MKKIAIIAAAALLLSSSCAKATGGKDAVIKVDEEGAEAAAVSSAGMFKTTAVAPGDHVIFHANQPFLYVITETSTGAVLFAGRYGAN